LKADKKFPINLVEFLGIFLYKDIFSKYYKNGSKFFIFFFSLSEKKNFSPLKKNFLLLKIRNKSI